MKITVAQYYKGFIGLQSVFAGVPFLPPLLNVLLPESSKIDEYLYPPVGDFQRLAPVASFGVLLLTTFTVFACCQLAKRVHPVVPVILTIGSAFGVCALIVLYVRFVRHVPVPSINLEVPVSIGYQRTDFATRTYPQWSDWDMLHDHGPWESKIQDLWTQSSIAVVRILLWLCHTLTLSCFLSVVCLAVYRHAAEHARSESRAH